MSQRYDQNLGGAGTTEGYPEKNVGERGNVQELGRMARDVASETYQNLRENASEYLDKGRVMFRDFESQFIRQIRANPVRSLLIAAGAGVVLGLVLKPSRTYIEKE